jgi:hypothetical protein
MIDIITRLFTCDYSAAHKIICWGKTFRLHSHGTRRTFGNRKPGLYTNLNDFGFCVLAVCVDRTRITSTANSARFALYGSEYTLLFLVLLPQWPRFHVCCCVSALLLTYIVLFRTNTTLKSSFNMLLKLCFMLIYR